MLNIRLVCVGNIKEKYYTDAINEYSKRLSAFCKLEIIELKEYKLIKENTEEINLAKSTEGKLIEKEMKGYTICLEIAGKRYDSVSLAQHIDKLATTGNSVITFVIGGSHGIDKCVSDKANEKLSFSDFTFPHQLMRVVLLEQIYRSFTIINGKNYHK